MVTDPYTPESGLNMGKVTADIVTVSHQSPNHSNVSGVGHEPRVVSGPGEYEVAGVLIGGIATAEEPGKGPRNTAYVMRVEDISICHLGDIAGKLTNQQIEALGGVDVLLVPVVAATRSSRRRPPRSSRRSSPRWSFPCITP